MTLLLPNVTVTVRRPTTTPDSHGWKSDEYVGISPPQGYAVSIQPRQESGNTSAARSEGFSEGPGDPGQAHDAIGYCDPTRSPLPGDHWITPEGLVYLVRTVVLVRGPLSPDLDVKRCTLSLVPVTDA